MGSDSASKNHHGDAVSTNRNDGAEGQNSQLGRSMKIDSLAEQHEYSKKTYWTTWRKAATKTDLCNFWLHWNDLHQDEQDGQLNKLLYA